MSRDAVLQAVKKAPTSGDFVWDGKNDDDRPATAEELRAAVRNRGGRPRGSSKESTTLRLDVDLLAALRATGPGWQSRVNELMRSAMGLLVTGRHSIDLFPASSGVSRARNRQVAVEPRPSGRWAVQTDGTSRADSLHDRQSDAIKRARQLAKNKETDLVIKGEDGRIRPKDSEIGRSGAVPADRSKFSKRG